VAVAAAVALLLGLAPRVVLAHCQIPCGIYDDEMRFRMLEEHVTTIEKSITMIGELSAEPGKNANQLVRWVMNKEDHADQVAEIVTQYFLQQRIKPEEADSAPDKWAAKVKACHALLVFSMKAKQGADLASVQKLREQVAALKQAYFSKEQAEHLEQDHPHSHSR
jgi:nickel superoxide dismutase